MSESPNIYQRINAVMGAVGYVKKDGRISMKTKNDKWIEYSATTHDAVTAVLRPHLVEQGIVITPTVTSHQQAQGTTIADIRVSFVNIDNPDDRIVIDVFGYGQDPGDKGPGKALSYAVKTAMLKTFCLETGEDDESRYQVDESRYQVKDECQPVPDSASKPPADLQKSVQAASTLEALTQLYADTEGADKYRSIFSARRQELSA